ncbi:efflux RND transporter permease subunit [Oharaeibacter diazotrophicus]|uniref:Multidrug efflux pump subunit AcrB n=1 Tax=Oharaeibacter diazotrophicus TaxID=1920512 RepID=A0A4R6R6N1_9HYPH|nr:efflux RND transporter permease subunit [Oharaeibacter diazotrophicus]TDP81197.1 multidrug efflux pump subunit AcrB [Oharaeibacter diazotrophicus]BBE74809.1 multidrug resistance protein MdtC [Pleomorphomonas sp. SM30]GLS75687.1 cation efflux system protein [Oharaeibacter diazotrophicus]
MAALADRFNLSRWAVTHQALVLFLIVVLSLGGLYSYVRLGRAEDPSFTVKVMVVSAVWPGATAAEMERQVADPIEKTLQEVPYFDKVRTYSRAGQSYLQLTLKDSTPPAAVADVWYQVRKRVGDLASSLPAGVLGPFFNDEFGDVDSALYMLRGDGVDMRALKDEAEAIRQRLLRVPAVEKVRFYGTRDEKIFVEFSHEKLASLGIAPSAIFAGIAAQNDMTPAGSIDTDTDRVNLRVSGALDGVEAVAAVPVTAGGTTFRLGDIATVRRGYQDPASYVVRHEGRPALAIGVVMADGANILTLGEDLSTALDEIRADLPLGFEIAKVADQPQVVEESVGEFVRVFVEALVIVLAVSFLSLGWRVGIVVALAVPLVLAVVMILLDMLGMSLERITLGALIIALGLLVDDAIIAVEMMVVKMEEGHGRLEAATFAWSSTAFPMLTGTLVTAAGFLPVGFAKSSAGEYAGGIFWVVGIALVASWVVAVVFTPYLGAKLLPAVKHHGGGGHDAHDGRAYRAMRAVVGWCVDHRILVVVLTLALFASSIVAFGHVQQQFFPNSPRPELTAEVRLPEGASFAATDAAMKKLEAVVAADDEVRTYTAYVGGGAPRWFMAANPELPKPNYGIVVLYAKGPEARDRVKARLEAWADAGNLPEARLRVSELVLGPPVGYPVQFRVIGPDPLEVRRIAYEVRDRVAADRDTVGANLDWNEQAKVVRLVVDQDRARALGLTPQSIARTLATLLSGYEVTAVRDGIESVGVVARAVDAERLDLDGLPSLTVTAADGLAVPLSQVARLDYGHEEPILWRQNRDTLITVRADVVAGVQPPDVSARIAPTLQPVIDALPVGYRIETGGSIEESAKANQALGAVFPVMILAMLTLLMIQLQSFGKLALVFSTAPLGLIGAAYGLLLGDRPFGFVAILGVIALAGMIMRNTVILVDQIAHDLDAGADPFDAVVGATVRRARPVVLTALAAILAMIPLSENVFWGPMAVAIMGGLAVATLLTLLFVPALYALAFRIRRPKPVVAEPAPAIPSAAVATREAPSVQRPALPLGAAPLPAE